MKFNSLQRAIMLVGLVVVIPVDSFGADYSNWERVRSIEPGRRIRVVLKNSHDLDGTRVMKGYFASSNDETMSLVRSDGVTTTIQKMTVKRLTARVPVLKRPGPWVLAGLALGVVQLFAWYAPDIAPFGGDDSVPVWSRTTLRGLAIVVAPVWGLSALALPNKVIYVAPRP